MSSFEQRLKDAREAAGLSQADVEFESRVQLPAPMRVSQVKVSRMERGAIAEEKADPMELRFLAYIYGTSVADLSELAAERLEVVTNLFADRGLSGTGWFNGTPVLDLVDA
jgi:transcriptional regulator with XRE-family HTH domain